MKVYHGKAVQLTNDFFTAVANNIEKSIHSYSIFYFEMLEQATDYSSQSKNSR